MSSERPPEEADILLALYARYGLASHYCAMIEWDVLTLMQAAAMRAGGSLGGDDVARLLDGAYKDLLDALVAELAAEGGPDRVATPVGFAAELQHAFEIRRRLAGYFRAKTLQVITLDGRVKMVRELNADCQRLQRTHEAVRAVVHGIFTRHGLSSDAIADALRRLLGFARDEVS